LFLLTVAPFPYSSIAADKTITIGVLAYRPIKEAEANLQPMADQLKKALPGHQVQLEALSFPELETALAAHRLDFVLTNPGHYIQLRHANNLSGVLATLIEQEYGHSIFSFGGLILTRSDRADISQLKDLRGKRIAVVGTSSFGGYQSQAYELLQAGVRLPNDATQVVTGMPHELTVQALLDGRADAAFVRTGVLEDLVRGKNSILIASKL
jgi:ABC-type phosphate/phosphonate transport system substrate-binding protein